MSLSHAVRVFLNTLFPYRKDAETVASLDPTTIENIHHVHMVDDVVALLPYNDERVRACVHELKYHDNERAAHLLGTVVNTYVRTLPGSQIVLIPIPLSHERHQSRGYNQCTRIAQRGARGVSVTVAENVLTRTRDTVPQTTLSKSARRKNVAHAFAISTCMINGSCVIVNGGPMNASWLERRL